MQISNTTSSTTVVLRSNPSIKATRFDPGKPLVRQELPGEPAFGSGAVSSFQDLLSMGDLDGYQAQLEKQGQMEQAMVIKKSDRIVGSIDRNSWAMFHDASIQGVWDQTKANPADFAQLLKKQGYQVDTYRPGAGPSYAEIHESIQHESYEALIVRQSLEFRREFFGRPGLPVY